jgi:cephalosporin hydroxylase
MESVAKVFEIGLGTNNPDVVSTMGKGGRPGASLRAFRDYLSDASVFGADFDRRVLFEEERIKTYFVDQTDPDTFEELGNQIGGNFDLMIDDGLHSPNANLHSLKFFLPRLKVGGYAVIEDVASPTVDLWKIVSSLLGEKYLSAFISTKSAYVFVVKRVA